MTEIYDSIRLGNDSRNADYLGTFVAWLVINKLIDPALESAAGSAAARVRMQDLTGAAFLTTVMHGELRSVHLTEHGRNFVEYYFVSGDYLADFSNRTGQEEDEWLLYDELAPKITAAWRRMQTPVKRLTAKILKFPKR